ncbi:MAG: hypothetical protein R6V53_06075 [Candidatus Woesearchaeota archaeon]
MQEYIIKITRQELAIKLNKILLGIIHKENIDDIITRTQNYVNYRQKELDPSEFTDLLQRINNTDLNDLQATEKILQELDPKAPYFKQKRYEKTVKKGENSFRELFDEKASCEQDDKKCQPTSEPIN